MELTPTLLLILAVAGIIVGLLIRWARRDEAASPVDAPRAPMRGTNMSARGDRDGQSLVSWLLERASEQTGSRVANDPLARQRIEEAAARAMEEIRANGSASISLPFLTADAQGPKHFHIQVKRNRDSMFEQER